MLGALLTVLITPYGHYQQCCHHPNLGVFVVMVKGNIDKINAELHTNYSQLLARGATTDDPIGILFDAYLLVPCYITTWHGPSTSLRQPPFCRPHGRHAQPGPERMMARA